jgi:L-fuconolactonase
MIDAHVHIWDLPDAKSPTPGYSATVETLLAEMDCAGVERAVLVQPRIFGADHSYLERVVRAHPDRFMAVGLIDLFSSDAPADVARLLDGLRPGGIRMHLKGSAAERARSSDETRLVLQQIGDADLTISILTSPDALPSIATLAAEMPETRIVVDHLGSPTVGKLYEQGYRAALSQLNECPNVWIKASGFYSFSSEGSPFDDCAPLVRWVVDGFGPDRVVWGSDFPYVTQVQPYGDCVQHRAILLSDCSESERAKISKENAIRLWS